jgi:ParB family chromosome partitioning protein
MGKKRLGRGLAPGAAETPAGRTIADVPLAQVRPGAHQPRRRFDNDALAQLADSIKAGGVIQPLILRSLPGSGYEIIAGERRWRAAKLAGLETVPAIIKDIDNQTVMEVAIIENLQREDLNPIEEAEAYLRLTDDFHLSQEDVARKVGKDRSTISNTLRLLKLPKHIQGDVIAGALSAGHARAILALATPKAQMALAEQIRSRGLSVREAETLVNAPKRPEKKKPASRRDVHLRRAEEDLKRKYGTKVSIKGTEKFGRIIFEYYTNDDLIRLVDVLNP